MLTLYPGTIPALNDSRKTFQSIARKGEIMEIKVFFFFPQYFPSYHRQFLPSQQYVMLSN